MRARTIPGAVRLFASRPMTTTPPLHAERPERVLVIVAHPDDAEFAAAATIAAWVDAGTEAHLVCCTSGDAGADDARTDPLALARLREEEQRAAAAVVGYRSVTFLHQPDGALANDLILREQLVRVTRTVRPDAVMCGDPTVILHDDGWIQHTDHRAAALAAVDAVYPAARNALAFPALVLHEGLEPHSVGRLYLFWSDRPSVLVDVTATAERKIAALAAHASQIREPAELAGRVREWLAETGAPAGVAAAEAFRLLDLR